MVLFRSSWVFLVGAMFFPFVLSGKPVVFAEPLSPRLANYEIKVRLDSEARLLRGEETLTWRNAGTVPVSELQFHLYQNAFRNDRSTFMKELEREGRGIKVKKDGWGYMEVEKISLGEENLTAKMEFIHPDDDNTEDRTVFRLVLPRPLPPGESITLQIVFRTRLPEPPLARSGSRKEYYFVSQWFPKIGVFQDGRWNCHQYHAHSEFFADYGVYDVWMTVPGKNVVGATGVEVERRKNEDGTVTHYYHAEDVHDFAWTTSPRFREVKGRAQDVEIRILLQPEHAGQGERHLAAARLAVEYFQNWYGDYPYPNLTVVDPKPGAGETGGMEYPTLITAGTFTGLPAGVRAVEMVIIHEFGHNFWYHLVGNNEFEDSWLDEGINTYSEIQIMRDIYGKEKSMMDFLGVRVDEMQMRRYSYLLSPDTDPLKRNAWEYYSGASYRAMSYSKPALALITLENYLGTETMRRILREFLARGRFKHPATNDFIAVANEVSGRDLNWFFNQAIYSNAVLDYSVDRVSCRERKPGKGYDYTLSVAEPAGKPEGKPEQAQGDQGGRRKFYVSEVWLRRLGDFKFPVELEVSFADGGKIREFWDGQELWKKFVYTRPAKLTAAVIDPEEKVPLDLNFKNNRRSLRQEKIKEPAVLEWLRMLFFLVHPSAGSEERLSGR